MEPAPTNGKRRMRFTVREMLLLMAVIALAIGWYRSEQEAQARSQRQLNRMMGLRMQAQLGGRGEETERDHTWTAQQSNLRVFYGIDLHGAALRGVAIDAGQQAAFQKMVFDVCDLTGATLSGGVSSFQEASFLGALMSAAKLSGGGSAFQGAVFDEADLNGAKLSGGGAAFQASSFVGADLTKAQLSGGGASFQLASFADADLSGAKLIGGGASYQVMDLDGAKFQGADLSALQAADLASCHFDAPPTYDRATKFPAGFDPQLQGWKRVD